MQTISGLLERYVSPVPLPAKRFAFGYATHLPFVRWVLRFA